MNKEICKKSIFANFLALDANERLEILSQLVLKLKDPNVYELPVILLVSTNASPRLLTSLAAIGVYSLNVASQLTVEQLYRILGLGKSSRQELHKLLIQYGFPTIVGYNNK